MARPAKMKALSAGKTKSDALKARTIADLPRCKCIPACSLAPPGIRKLRRPLRYRCLVAGQAVRMKNKMAGLLYGDCRRLREAEVTSQEYSVILLGELAEIPESAIDLPHLIAIRNLWTGFILVSEHPGGRVQRSWQICVEDNSAAGTLACVRALSNPRKSLGTFEPRHFYGTIVYGGALGYGIVFKLRLVFPPARGK